MIFNKRGGVFFDADLATRIRSFQNFAKLPVTGRGDFQTWASLLVSTSDATRRGTAADCVTEVTDHVLPHFRGIRDIMNEHGQGYLTGIYGPRNVCSRVVAAGYTSASFVCDMSTGFSGNLGYPLPADCTTGDLDVSMDMSRRGALLADVQSYLLNSMGVPETGGNAGAQALTYRSNTQHRPRPDLRRHRDPQPQLRRPDRPDRRHNHGPYGERDLWTVWRQLHDDHE
ncbi:glycoside hydrolase domain-containing protein [Streptomyces niveiscabiei]|uniref:Glycoside hydrolase domain-containing protein n=1 Tax=Streptomyces niveiscabiei TaxID=164115 RepID=A0ABW9HH92_9ACTN